MELYFWGDQTHQNMISYTPSYEPICGLISNKFFPYRDAPKCRPQYHSEFGIEKFGQPSLHRYENFSFKRKVTGLTQVYKSFPNSVRIIEDEDDETELFFPIEVVAASENTGSNLNSFTISKNEFNSLLKLCVVYPIHQVRYLIAVRLILEIPAILPKKYLNDIEALCSLNTIKALALKTPVDSITNYAGGMKPQELAHLFLVLIRLPPLDYLALRIFLSGREIPYLCTFFIELCRVHDLYFNEVDCRTFISGVRKGIIYEARHSPERKMNELNTEDDTECYSWSADSVSVVPANLISKEYDDMMRNPSFIRVRNIFFNRSSVFRNNVHGRGNIARHRISRRFMKCRHNLLSLPYDDNAISNCHKINTTNPRAKSE
eukprot:snap_masked-scaffold_1-processed-gene-15.33-mRNA-1 protein AED:1.00 eAED:1.00 QI:0/0/0/0/1/1/2/0/375